LGGKAPGSSDMGGGASAAMPQSRPSAAPSNISDIDDDIPF